jgi:hypothetical protein
MRRVIPLLCSLGILACNDSPIGPNPIYPGYSLFQVDEDFLPIPWGEDGSVLIAASLVFEREVRPRQSKPDGMVTYTLWVRLPNFDVQRSTMELEFFIENDELRINLCPPLALCITTTELIAPLSDPAQELVFTHYVGGLAGTVYRYSAALPE